MQLGKTNIIIYFRESRLWIEEAAFDWNKANLVSILSKLRDKGGPVSVKVLLGNELSYVVAAAIPAKSPSREDVLKEAQALLPIKLTDENFDWKKVTFGKNETYAQIMAVDVDFLNLISNAFREAKLIVEGIVPAAVFVGEKKVVGDKPALVYWGDREDMLVYSNKGLIMMATEGGKNAEEIKKLSDYIKETWGADVSKRLIGLNAKNFSIKTTMKDWKEKGRDEEVLGVNLLKKINTDVDQGAQQVTIQESKPKGGNRNMFSQIGVGKILALLASILLLVGVVVFRTRQVPAINLVTPQGSSIVTTTPEITPTEMVTEAPLNVSNLNISIENASQVTGRAKQAAAILTAAGFAEPTVGDSTQNLAIGTIQIKDAVDSRVVDKIKNLLNQYNFTTGPALTNDNQFDVLVLIGQQ